MGIFSKKYDYETDRIKYEFDLEQDKYCFYKDGIRLSEKEISFASKRFLKKKNNLTPEEKEQRRSIARMVKAQEQDRTQRKIAVDKRKEVGIELSYDSFEVESVNKPRFSEEIEEYLDGLTSEEKDAEYVLGIHRIGPSEEHLEDIFNQGIRVQGHMIGAAKGIPELKNTVGYYPSNSVIKKEVGLAYVWKSSKGSIVVKIPKTDIISNNIYVMDEEQKYMYLNPKYIVGYFPLEEDKTVSKIVTKDSLQQYKNQRVKEAQEYISMGKKEITYSPPEVE